jgi:hypothetical protein
MLILLNLLFQCLLLIISYSKIYSFCFSLDLFSDWFCTVKSIKWGEKLIFTTSHIYSEWTFLCVFLP